MTASAARARLVIDLSTQVQGFNINSTLNTNGTLVFNNYTPYTLTFNFQDGTMFPVYPGQANKIVVTQNEANFTCTFVQTIAGTPQSTQFFIDVYDAAADLSGYQYPTQASAFIGGGSVSSIDHLINTGNSDGTQVIYVQAASSGTTNFLLYANGKSVWTVQSNGLAQQVLAVLPQGDLTLPAKAGTTAVVAVGTAFLYLNNIQNDVQILIPVPDSGQRSIDFFSPTANEIKWQRDTTAALAFKVLKQSSLATLFSVSDTGVPSVASPPVLLTGNQETGYFGSQLAGGAGAGQATHPTAVNYKTVMTNTPSSITLVVNNQNNTSTYSGVFIDRYGFAFGYTAVVASTFANTFAYGDYTTVGNCVLAVHGATFDRHCDGCGQIYNGIPFASLRKDALDPGVRMVDCACGAVEVYVGYTDEVSAHADLVRTLFKALP